MQPTNKQTNLSLLIPTARPHWRSDVDKTPAKPTARGMRGLGEGGDTYRILKFVVGSFQNVFRSCDRRQYSGSLL